MKVGYQGSYQKSLQARDANATLLQYRFNNGVPNAFGYYLAPRWEQNDRTATSLFVQDQWTKERLTLQGALALRPRVELGPGRGQRHDGDLAIQSPADHLPRTVSVAGYNDITPRMGAAYDVFGNGKTAIKVNLGKYLQAATNDENYWANNPAGTHRDQRRQPRRGWKPTAITSSTAICPTRRCRTIGRPAATTVRR